MTSKVRRWFWWGMGGAAGLGALALLTVLAVYLSAAFVVRYAEAPRPAAPVERARPAP